MPHSISIDPRQGLARIRFDGVITGLDIIAATDELVAHPDFSEAYDQTWILTEVTSLVISPEAMAAMVAHDTALVASGAMGTVRVAIVVTGELRTIAAKLYRHRMKPSGQRIELFVTEAAADAWVNEGRRAA